MRDRLEILWINRQNMENREKERKIMRLTDGEKGRKRIGG